MRHATLMLLPMLLAAPAGAVQTAIGNSILEDFEGYATGPLSTDYCVVGSPDDCLGTLSGGTIAAGDSSFPAVSGTQVYVGTSIGLSIANAVDFSWPAVMGRVTTGAAPVTLTVYDFDPDSGLEDVVATQHVAAGLTNTSFGAGSESNLLFLTRFTLTSDSPFAIDDLVMGLETVAPGVPEPRSWALLISGFGLTGAVLRRRRAAGPIPAC